MPEGRRDAPEEPACLAGVGLGPPASSRLTDGDAFLLCSSMLAAFIGSAADLASGAAGSRSIRMSMATG